MWAKNKQLGFTMVELSIVIVVIGILATITIVGYSGAQQRARNAQTSTAVKEFKGALLLYKSANNGSYPAYPSSVCLGDAYPGGKCWLDNINQDAAFMTTLRSTTGDKLPMPAIGKGSLKGVWYSPSTWASKLDGAPRAFIAYVMEGSSTKCPVGPIATLSDDGVNLTSDIPPSGQSYPPNQYGDVQCWIPLPE